MSWDALIDYTPSSPEDSRRVDDLYRRLGGGRFQDRIASKVYSAFHHEDVKGITSSKKEVIIDCLARSVCEAGPSARFLSVCSRATIQTMCPLDAYDNATWYSYEIPTFSDIPEERKQEWILSQRRASAEIAAAFCCDSVCPAVVMSPDMFDIVSSCPMTGDSPSSLPCRELARAMLHMETDFRKPLNAEIFVSAMCVWVLHVQKNRGKKAAHAVVANIDPMWLLYHPIYKGRFKAPYLSACSIFASCGRLPSGPMLRYIIGVFSRPKNCCSAIADVWCELSYMNDLCTKAMVGSPISPAEIDRLCAPLGKRDGPSQPSCSANFSRAYSIMCACGEGGRLLRVLTTRFVMGQDLALELCAPSWKSDSWVKSAAVLPAGQCKGEKWCSSKCLPLYAVAPDLSTLISLLRVPAIGLPPSHGIVVETLLRYAPQQFLFRNLSIVDGKDPPVHTVSEEGGVYLHSLFHRMHPYINTPGGVIDILERTVILNQLVDHNTIKALRLFFIDVVFSYTINLTTRSIIEYISHRQDAERRGAGGNPLSELPVEHKYALALSSGVQVEDRDIDMIAADITSAKTSVCSLSRLLSPSVAHAGIPSVPDEDLACRAILCVMGNQVFCSVPFRYHPVARAAIRLFKNVLATILGSFPSYRRILSHAPRVSNIPEFRTVYELISSGHDVDNM